MKLNRMTEYLLSLNENSQAQTKIIDELKQILSGRDNRSPGGDTALNE